MYDACSRAVFILEGLTVVCGDISKVAEFEVQWDFEEILYGN